MLSEKGNVKTEALFSDDRSHRYLLRKEWDAKKEKVAVLMTHPSTADLYAMDYTTLYILNNLLKLDVGSVEVINLLSIITTKLTLPSTLDQKHQEENVQQIIKSAQRVDKLIIAWGSRGENSRKIRLLQEDLLEELAPYQDKLFVIADGMGRVGFHPLAPQIRFTWYLKPFIIPEKKTSVPALVTAAQTIETVKAV